MRLLLRQTPLVIKDRYDFAKAGTEGTKHARQTSLWCHSLRLSGLGMIETAEGTRPIVKLKPGREIVFRPETVSCLGRGLDISIGDSVRHLSPREAWSVAVTWLLHESLSLADVGQYTELPMESDVMLRQSRGSFLESTRDFYRLGIQIMDRFQLKGFLRGAMWVYDAYAVASQEWPKEARQHFLMQIDGAIGRWLGHMGLILDQRGILPLRLRASCFGRFSEDEAAAVPYEAILLPICSVSVTMVRAVRLISGRVLGFWTEEEA